MAGTPALGRLLDVVTRGGAVLRLVGDPMQLSAVEAGGALRLLVHHGDAAVLGRVHRFADPAEATASLQLRRGNPAALGFYDSRSRLTDGSRQEMLEEVYDAWRADQAAGCSTLMVSASSVEVAALCARARADRVTAGDVEPDGVRLHDGNQAGTGDVVVTRANRRTLAVLGGRDFVKNGDLWRVTARHSTGELTLTHLGHGGRVRLPAEYAAGHVELGYATTVHRAQGMTVDTAHVLVDKTMCRESLYVAMSRGRTGNHAYVVTDEMLDVDLHHQPAPRLDAIGVLTGVLAREGSERSATETIQAALEAAESLSTLVPRYLDALTRATVTPEVEAAVRAGLRDAGGPALEHQASHAPGWHRLLVASAGPHARETVADAVRGQLLDAAGVHDVAGLLAARVARLGAEYGDGAGVDPGGSWRPPWLPAPTALGLSDPVAAWAIRQDQLVCQRVHALVEQVAADPPAWARTIVGRPDTGPERAAWERDVAVVAAYRDQHGIPDHVAQPVIPPNQGNAVLAVRHAWLRLQPSNQAVPRSEETVARLREFAARPGPDYGELSRQEGMPVRRPRPPDLPARPDLTPRGPRR